jgi:hypothetical protein
LVAAALAQWSPLIMAAALLPAIQFFAAGKLNIGMAAYMYRPTWRGLMLIIILVGISLAILPDWPRDWLGGLTDESLHKSPILVMPAALLLLISAIKWRKAEGRVLFILSIVPQTLWYYDQLLLFLIPKGLRANLILMLFSWIGYGAWKVITGGGIEKRPDVFVVTFIFFPALGLLFWEDSLMLWKNWRASRS